MKFVTTVCPGFLLYFINMCSALLHYNVLKHNKHKSGQAYCVKFDAETIC